jgi:chromosome segregation ATPase
MSTTFRDWLTLTIVTWHLLSPGQSVVAETSDPVRSVTLVSDDTSRPVSQDVAKEGSVDESIGLHLARTQFRELVPVLDHLRAKSPQQYERAVRDLERSAKKLDSIRRRDKKLFEIALREWKTRGQIDLLKAKLKVKASESDRKAVLEHLRTLRETELDRISRELALLDERDAAYKERMQQLNQVIKHGESLRSQLNEKRERLQSETIDQNSQVYLKAIGTVKSSQNRSPSSLKQ